MMITILNPLDYPHWDEFLLRLPEHSFFHSSAWAEVLVTSYGYTPLYIALYDRGQLDALLPLVEINSILTGKRGVSLPFSDYCEPIVSDHNQFQFMLNFIADLGRQKGWKYVEIRGGQSFLKRVEASEDYYRHTLDLTGGIAKVYPQLGSSTKRNINKAEREKVTSEISVSLDSVKDFYRLNCMTRRGHGLPPQPFYFFKNIYDRILSRGLGFISLATFDNRTISSNIYFCFGGEVIYKYGASDHAFQHLRANDLVMWKAITWSSDRGYKHLSLGRTEPGNSGLRRFKLGWGAKESQIRYFKYDLKQGNFIKYPQRIPPFMSKISTNMPQPILNAAGSFLYKHMG